MYARVHPLLAARSVAAAQAGSSGAASRGAQVANGAMTPVELTRGTWLGNYRIVAPLGSGGMARVWVAWGRPYPNAPEQLVAVKVMLPEIADCAESRDLFLQEGQLARSIEHPNVVRAFDIGECRGVLYMAMDWVEGDSLRALMAEACKRRPIPLEMAVRLVAGAAAGLHAAHELRGPDGRLREVVHCDVSPHNILVGIDGVVRVLDFGMARAMKERAFTHGRKVGGKAGYMSPEQVHGRLLDRRSDVFSLGIILYEITTGNRLFRGKDPRSTCELVASGPIAGPSSMVEGYPRALDAIVMKALERNRRRRYQSAEEFRLALEGFLVEERVVVPAAGVQGLVQRVLGGRIVARRKQIARALLELREAADLGPSAREHCVGDDDVVRASVSWGVPVLQEPLAGDTLWDSNESLRAGTAGKPRGFRSRFTAVFAARRHKILALGALGLVLASGTSLSIALQENSEATRPARSSSQPPVAESFSRETLLVAEAEAPGPSLANQQPTRARAGIRANLAGRQATSNPPNGKRRATVQSAQPRGAPPRPREAPP